MSHPSDHATPQATGVKTCIAKQACIVLNDVVSHCLPASMHDSILIAQIEQYFFYCSALAFNQARATEPQLPIYGFWQILHASGFFDEQTSWAVVYTSPDAGGRFFYRNPDKGVCMSGEVCQGKPVLSKQIALPDISSAKVYDFNTMRLRLPDTPILTLAERNQHRQVLQKHRTIKAAAALSCFVAGFLALHYQLAAHRAEQQSLYNQAQSQVQQLREQQARFVATQKASWPWQWPVLEMVYRLATVDEQLNVWGLDLDQDVFEASIKPSVQLPNSIRDDLDEVNHQPDGTMVVRWSQPR